MSCKERCILGADSESDERSRIAQDRLPKIFRELSQVLMAERERERILARLRQDHRKAVAGVILKLISVEVERAAIVLGRVRPRECGSCQGRREQGSKQMRGALTDRSKLSRRPPPSAGSTWSGSRATPVSRSCAG